MVICLNCYRIFKNTYTIHPSKKCIFQKTHTTLLSIPSWLEHIKFKGFIHPSILEKNITRLMSKGDEIHIKHVRKNQKIAMLIYEKYNK